LFKIAWILLIVVSADKLSNSHERIISRPEEPGTDSKQIDTD
jgi:hypothetical protein